jgi:hypothetical protein
MLDAVCHGCAARVPKVVFWGTEFVPARRRRVPLGSSHDEEVGPSVVNLVTRC